MMQKNTFVATLLLLLSFNLFIGLSVQYYYIDTNQKVVDSDEYSSQINFKPVAMAEFQDQINSSGWNYLKIKTNKEFSDILQMRLAGYLEGYITFAQISDYYDNYVAFSLQGEPYLSANGTAYVENQFKFIKSQIKKHRHSKFWQMTDGVLQQLEGMYEGYMKRIEQEEKLNSKQYSKMTWFQFTLMTAREDLFEIIQCYPTQLQSSVTAIPNIGHCSGFVKIVNGKLFNTHASWYTYSDMLRIYKVYEFNLNNPKVKARRITFSSYPAHVNSLDDFYQITNTNMSIMGTSLGFNNQSLCNTLSTETIPSWIRVNVANRFGYNGKKWLKVYKKFFSGTHNNQWMVIDFKKFAKNSPKGVLYVLENFFYLYKPFDATQRFLAKKGYFASFNAAINKDINQVAFAKSDMLFGNNMTASNQYYTAFRYFIFKKYQHKAVDLQSVKDLMRQRTYLFKDDNPMKQISCRIDQDQSCLNQSTSIYKKVDGINIGCAMGAYDCKVNDNEMMNTNTVHIINGPSTQGFPVFEFTGPWEQVPHKGIPTVMNFDWQVFDTTVNFQENQEQQESIVQTLLHQIQQ